MTTNQVVKATGLTPRMLQHWDETGIIKPHIMGHSREYTDAEVDMLRIVNQLRDVGVSLQLVRKIIPAVRKYRAAHGMPRFITGVDEWIECCQSPEQVIASQTARLKKWAKLPHRGPVPPRVFVVDTGAE